MYEPNDGVTIYTRVKSAVPVQQQYIMYTRALTKQFSSKSNNVILRMREYCVCSERRNKITISIHRPNPFISHWLLVQIHWKVFIFIPPIRTVRRNYISVYIFYIYFEKHKSKIIAKLGIIYTGVQLYSGHAYSGEPSTSEI